MNRVIESKDVEVLHWQATLEHVHDESDVKFKVAHEKYDELQARYLHLEERLLIVKDKNKIVVEEHVEYEDIIHRAGGMTVSEVEVKALEVSAWYASYRSEYGRDSWQFQEQVDELKRLGGFYKIVLVRQPQLRRWLTARTEAEASASTHVPSVLRLADRPSQQSSIGRGQGQIQRSQFSRAQPSRSQINRGRGVTRGRGRGRDRINIDNL